MDLLSCASNYVCTSSLVIFLTTGMGNKPCNENYHKMVIRQYESTGMYPMIPYTKILPIRWNVILINIINMLIGDLWKILLLLCRYINKRNKYMLESVQMDIKSCSDNIVCTEYFIKYWSPVMVQDPCYVSLHKW